jgi:hypothetical protein
MLRYVTRPGGWWIRSQQRHFHPRGRALRADERDVLRGYYSDDVLSEVRLHRLGTEPSNQIVVPMVLKRMAGITLGRAVVIAPQAPDRGIAWSRLLFHELVHVVQFSLLGIDEFVSRYVGGWTRNGFRYRDIPLEQHAYELEARFAASPLIPFSVESEVGTWLSGLNPARPSD